MPPSTKSTQKRRRKRRRFYLPPKLAGFISAMTIRCWMSTLDYRAVFYDPRTDPASPDCGGRAIYILWHETMLIPIHLRGHCGMTMLVSQHRDAEALTNAGYYLGHSTVRGSTHKGGMSALRKLFREGTRRHLVITPDGPRGPRRKLAQGPVYLASKLGLPLVCLGLGYDRPWRMNSWDRFAVPRPFSRARAIVSPYIQIPPGIDREQLEVYRQRVEDVLNALTEEAEDWAVSGKRHKHECPGVKAHAPRHLRDNLSQPQLFPFPPAEPSPAIARTA